MNGELNVRFVFHEHPIGTKEEVVVLMPMPPRRGEAIDHEGAHYRVEEVRYTVGKQYQPVDVIVDCFATMPQGGR